MKRTIAALVLAVACVLVHAPRVDAQCTERCIKFVTPEGSGYGCIVDNDSGMICIARSTSCYSKLCSNAMVTDPSGRTLAVAEICSGNVIVHSRAHVSKPRSAAKLQSRRALTE